MLEYSCSLLTLSIICLLKIQEWTIINFFIINYECLLAQSNCIRRILPLNLNTGVETNYKKRLREIKKPIKLVMVSGVIFVNRHS